MLKDEPTYEYRKGVGWIVESYPSIMVALSDGHTILEIIDRAPEPGERGNSVDGNSPNYVVGGRLDLVKLAAWAASTIRPGIWNGAPTIDEQRLKSIYAQKCRPFTIVIYEHLNR